MKPAPSLAPSIVDCVHRALADHAGLEPPTWFLQARLAERIAALGLPSPTDYADLVTSERGGAELALLVEALRVGKTRFFRHRAHVAAVHSVVVPALAGRSTVRAWSAGCASGEEAYTLALVLAHALGDPARIDVLATDISDEALAVARVGVYPESALDNVPAGMRQWFAATGDGRWKIAGDIAARVRLRRHNLADGQFPSGFDLIWCRNVLIYFAPAARQAAIRRLIDSLADGGFLFVGYAETLRDFEQLQAVRAPDAVLYRKHEPAPNRPGALRPSRPPPRAAPRPATDPASLIDSPAITAEEAVVELRGRYDDGQRLARELTAALSGHYRRVVIDLDGADYLGTEAAAVLRGARSAAIAAGVELCLLAERTGTRRWLRRSGLAEEDAP